ESARRRGAAASGREKRSSTAQSRARASFRATVVDATNLPLSRWMRLWRVMPERPASSSCVRPAALRRSRRRLSNSWGATGGMYSNLYLEFKLAYTPRSFQDREGDGMDRVGIGRVLLALLVLSSPAFARTLEEILQDKKILSPE